MIYGLGSSGFRVATASTDDLANLTQELKNCQV